MSRILTHDELVAITEPCQRNEPCPFDAEIDAEDVTSKNDQMCHRCEILDHIKAQDSKTASLLNAEWEAKLKALEEISEQIRKGEI
jgi:hypothetical protein